MKNTKKKVLFVATVDSHIELFHLPYLKMFKDEGYEVHVATNTDKKIEFCDKKHKISIARSPFRLCNLKAIRQLRKIVNEEHFDIIHCHTPMGGVVARLAAKKARKNGTRMIYTAHGFHFYKGAPLKNWLLFYPVEKYLAKYTDTLITINNEDFERAKKKFGKRCRDIEYVPGVGVDEKKFKKKLTKEEKHNLRKSLGLKDDDFVMIFPAELSKRKNQMWLIKTLKPVFDEDKKKHLLLPGKDSLDGKCQKLAKKLGLEDQVHFLGFRNDIDKLLKISDLAVSSSKQEGLPVNLIEAAFCGLPIVATDCRGNRDICEDAITLEEGNYFIKKILAAKRECKRSCDGEKRDIIVDKHSLLAIYEKMHDLYSLDAKKQSKCVIICWYGHFPDWYKFWEYSCSKNKDYDYLIFTDQKVKSKYKNIIINTLPLEDINKLFSRKLGLTINISQPYKLCDFRPAYGLVFEDYLKGYDFWGHCDMDLIFGKLSHFIKEETLSKYDVINKCGHFKLFRNCEKINNLFKCSGSIFSYKEVFTSDKNYAFDEYSGINRIIEKNGIRHMSINDFADIDVRHSRYRDKNGKNYKKQYYLYEEDKLFKVYECKEKNVKKEIFYLHFQKKCPLIRTRNLDHYCISSDGFTECFENNSSTFSKNKYRGAIYESLETAVYYLKRTFDFITSSKEDKTIKMKKVLYRIHGRKNKIDRIEKSQSSYLKHTKREGILFSIIIPACNSEKYIGECLGSIIAQDFKSYEIIVIDDGSSDGTYDICKTYAKKYENIKIVHQENKGVSIARSNGVRIAKGAYLLFCDSDDIFHKNTLSEISRIIDNNDVDIVCAGVTRDYDKLKVVSTGTMYNKREKEKYIFPYLIENKTGKIFPNNIAGCAFRKDLYIENQVNDIAIDLGEDLACKKACIYNAVSMYNMDSVLYYNRRHKESATMSKNVFLLDGPKRIGKHLESKIDIDKYDMKSQLQRMITHELFLVILSQFNDKTYSDNKKAITMALKDPYYNESINECKYSILYYKGNIAKFMLKHNMVYIMYMMSKIKYLRCK